MGSTWCQAVLLVVAGSLALTTALLSPQSRDTEELPDTDPCQVFIAVLVKCDAGVDDFNKIKSFVKENVDNCMGRPANERPDEINIYYPSIAIDDIRNCTDANCVDDVLSDIWLKNDTCVSVSELPAHELQTMDAIQTGLLLLLLDKHNNTPYHNEHCSPTLLIVSDFESQTFAFHYDSCKAFRTNLSHVEFRMVIVNDSTEFYKSNSSILDDEIYRFEDYDSLAGKDTRFCPLRPILKVGGLSGLAIAAICVAAVALLILAFGIVFFVHYKNKHLDWRNKIMQFSSGFGRRQSATTDEIPPSHGTPITDDSNNCSSQLGAGSPLGSARRAASSALSSDHHKPEVIYPSWLQNPTEHLHRSNSHDVGLDTETETDLWEIPRDQVIVKRDVKLGNGVYGEVFKGTIIGEAPIEHIYKTAFFAHQYEDCDCAIKMLPAYADAHSHAEFLREIHMMKELGFHPNIVSMLGCITVSPPMCLLLEHAYYGDMARFLQERKDRVTLAPVMDPERRAATNDDTVSIKDLLSFAWQVSDGMEYLHGLDYVHRDLAARNVFVNRSMNAMIGDFGLCRKAENTSYTSKAGRLPIKWMAIESLKSYQFSTKSDVWSFGVLMYEIFSMGMVPYIDTPQTEMVSFLSAGNRLARPMYASNEVYNIMQSCWKELPIDRPPFNVLRERLSRHLEEATEDCGYLNLSEVPVVGSCSSTLINEEK